MAWHPKSAQCVGCPAETIGLSFTKPRGPAAASVLLIGQGPGETEASLGVPFVGKSGQKLGTWLRLAGLDPNACRFTNVNWCWLPDNRMPTQAEIDHCRVYWEPELAGRRVIVPVGVPAMRQFYSRAGESTAGQIIRWTGGECADSTSAGTAHPEDAGAEGLPPTTYVVGLLHPAFIMRGNFGLEPLQIQTLKLVKRIVDGWEPPIYDFTQPYPGSVLYPTLEELRTWRAGFAAGEEIAIDVEAAGRVLRMVGMCRLSDLAYVAVWFRSEGGDVWPYPDFGAVIEWLYDLLADPSVGKVFHNAAYDIEQLEEVGFEVENFSYDTLLATHLAFPELRKRLESVSLMCSGVTGWKAYLRNPDGHHK